MLANTRAFGRTNRSLNPPLLLDRVVALVLNGNYGLAAKIRGAQFLVVEDSGHALKYVQGVVGLRWHYTCEGIWGERFS